MGGTVEYQAFPRGDDLKTLPGAAGTAKNPQTVNGTFNLGDLAVEGYTGLAVTLDITAITAANLKVYVDELDETSSKYVQILAVDNAGAGYTVTGTNRGTVSPLLSKKIRLRWIVASAGTVTFTVSYKLSWSGGN